MGESTSALFAEEALKDLSRATQIAIKSAPGPGVLPHHPLRAVTTFYFLMGETPPTSSHLFYLTNTYISVGQALF